MPTRSPGTKSTQAPRIYVGCAGWSLSSSAKPDFPGTGTHLARYALRMAAVEINSSFYRPHRYATYAKWAASVPAAFRFSVKVPKAITHQLRLERAGVLLKAFTGEVSGLGDKLGCLLIQLPPSLEFRPLVAAGFFAALRKLHRGAVVLEPRHSTWFTGAVAKLLEQHRIARVAANPAPVPAAAEPSGWAGTVYYRLHGSPQIYTSAYQDDYLAALAARLGARAGAGAEVWCIFDNTIAGASIPNALRLMRDLDQGAPPPPQ
jgi:uncharacterized protein YecE (DUF72 family)